MIPSLCYSKKGEIFSLNYSQFHKILFPSYQPLGLYPFCIIKGIIGLPSLQAYSASARQFELCLYISVMHISTTKEPSTAFAIDSRLEPCMLSVSIQTGKPLSSSFFFISRHKSRLWLLQLIIICSCRSSFSFFVESTGSIFVFTAKFTFVSISHMIPSNQVIIQVIK